MTATLPFGPLDTAKALVIGHDPALQGSATQASYAFFADMYFGPLPASGSERAKYDLAKAMYDYIYCLSNGRYKPEDIYVTNLCNERLRRTSDNKGKVVYIPEDCALRGVDALKGVVAQHQFESIFAMSQQVNYWLQKLGFCEAVAEYLAGAEPRQKDAAKGIYASKGTSPFLKICGSRLTAQGVPLFPILHVKQIPLDERLAPHYAPLLEKVKRAFTAPGKQEGKAV
ncbi:MAG TPA: hypothetical protein VGL38_09435 [bacterium]